VTNWLWQGPMYSTGRSRPERQFDLASEQRLRWVRPSNAQTGPCHVVESAASVGALRRCLLTPDRPTFSTFREPLATPCSSVTQSTAQTHRGWPWRIRHTLLEPLAPHWNPSHEAACIYTATGVSTNVYDQSINQSINDRSIFIF